MSGAAQGDGAEGQQYREAGAAAGLAPAAVLPAADGSAGRGVDAAGDKLRAPELEAEAEAEADAAFELRQAAVSAGQHQQRLDKVLVAMAPEFSRSHLQHLIDRGHVRVDGMRAETASRRLRAGQQVALELVPTDESLAFRPQPLALAVLYEDEHLLVIDKPAGLVVHPAPGHWQGTLLNGLLARHAAAATLPRAGIVHRLDKDTSGVMVVAKTLQAATALVREIAARRVHRRYLALAHGVPEPARQTIEAPIGRDPQQRLRMAVVAGGKPARTDVHRLAVAAPADGGSGPEPGAGPGAAPRSQGARPLGASSPYVSALSCTLHTGRTHQIRVHLAWRGHPLLADALYGGRPALGLQRQALHAAELRLAHPGGGAVLHVRCPPPADFAAAWAAAGGPVADTLQTDADADAAPLLPMAQLDAGRRA